MEPKKIIVRLVPKKLIVTLGCFELAALNYKAKQYYHYATTFNIVIIHIKL